jgi:hypothetical protein
MPTPSSRCTDPANGPRMPAWSSTPSITVHRFSQPRTPKTEPAVPATIIATAATTTPPPAGTYAGGWRPHPDVALHPTGATISGRLTVLSRRIPRPLACLLPPA